MGELLDSDHYFIDMKLYNLNLETYIHHSIASNSLKFILYFIKNISLSLKTRQIWNIMKQITSEIYYIYTLHMMHRDLKSANDKFASWHSHTYQCNTLFEKKFCMKISGFWILFERQLKIPLYFYLCQRNCLLSRSRVIDRQAKL